MYKFAITSKFKRAKQLNRSFMCRFDYQLITLLENLNNSNRDVKNQEMKAWWKKIEFGQ